MNIWKKSVNKFGFFLAGLFSALVSLIILLFFKNISPGNLLFLSTLTEEANKFISLKFLQDNLSIKSENSKNTFINLAFFTLGFVFLEYLLANLSFANFSLFSPQILFLLVIHFLSAFFLWQGLKKQSLKGFSGQTALFFLLAFFVHLCYNLVAYQINKF